MKTLSIAVILAMILTLTVNGTYAAQANLYLTAYGSSARTSSNDGVTWSQFLNFGSGRWRGGTCDSSGNVFFTNRDGSPSTAVPLNAYKADGTLIATNAYNWTDSFNQLPIGFFGGYVYVSAGAAGGTGQGFGSSSFNGTAFGSVPLASAGVGTTWQANDLAFGTINGTNFMFYNGTGGRDLKRSQLVGNGTCINYHLVITMTPSSGTLPANFTDYAFSANGRLLALGQGTTGSDGIWVSAPGKVANTAISITRSFAFSATETPANGDMGPNARDMVLLGTNLYAVSDTRCYHYMLDDESGTLTFDTTSGQTHGYNNNSTQIGGFLVPEPTLLGVLALGALLLRKRA